MARHPSRSRAARSRPEDQARAETASAQPGLRVPPMQELAIWLGLALVVAAIYAQTGRFEFLNYDDPDYVTNNPHVMAGLSLASIKWAFGAIVSANWMPVTLLSHILDCQLFGVQSGAQHLVNVLLHALSAILLFVCLRRATGAIWPGAFVAFVFAAHPLHVESVAWIAERKDVLFACFWFLALYLYIRYVERESKQGYLLVVLTFALGLMSKPMMVTFPFALLLFDVWPLRRPLSARLVIEKLPLFVLSAVSSVVTYRVQGSVGSVQEAIPLVLRLRGAMGAYATYLEQMFWPAGLAVFYPYRTVQIWEAVTILCALAGISALLFRLRREFPYLLFGWLWFLGTLVPVIGIVQVGAQATADRYTYLPFAGLSVMLAWGAAEIVSRRPASKYAISAVAVVACSLTMFLAHRQTAFWSNNEALFRHAIEVTKDNYVAKINLGVYLGEHDRDAEAIPLFEQVTRQIPTDAAVHNSLGILLAKLPDRKGEALSHFEAAVRLKPDFMFAQYNLGAVLSQIPGRKAEAIQHLMIAQQLQPSPAIADAIRQLQASE